MVDDLHPDPHYPRQMPHGAPRMRLNWAIAFWRTQTWSVCLSTGHNDIGGAKEQMMYNWCIFMYFLPEWRCKSWTFWNHYMSSLDELCELEGIPLNPQDLTQVCPEAVSLDPSKFHSWGFRNRWVLQWSFILKPCDLKHIMLVEKKDAAAYPALNLLVSPCESIRWSCSTWKAGKFVISRPWMQRMRNKS